MASGSAATQYGDEHNAVTRISDQREAISESGSARGRETMNRAKNLFQAGFVLALLLGAGAAWGASETRTSSFEYDPVTGLVTKEVIEPGDSDLCLVTGYGYDGFGNKTAVT